MLLFVGMVRNGWISLGDNSESALGPLGFFGFGFGFGFGPADLSTSTTFQMVFFT